MIPDLVISIVNHSNPQMLRDCIASIYATTHTIHFDIWVIDNATDQSGVAEMKAEFPAVKWLMNASRLGFSANHNQALSRAQGRYLCILNDDTIIQDGAFDELVRYMDLNSRCGMAGPRLLNRDGSIQNSTFKAKSLRGELIDILQLPGALCGLKNRGIDPAQFGDQPMTVDWLLGACIIVRKLTLDQVGLLDDVLSPIANCEETDWCARTTQAGWKICFVPTARVTHFGGQSLKSSSAKVGADRFRVEMHRVMLGYFRKHHGPIGLMFLRAVYVLSLPWNGVMLAQSALRGRTDSGEAKSLWATLVAIAVLSLKPLRRPYCREDLAGFGQSQGLNKSERAAGLPIGT